MECHSGQKWSRIFWTPRIFFCGRERFFLIEIVFFQLVEKLFAVENIFTVETFLTVETSLQSRVFYKGEWQQKFNSSHLKEILKPCMEAYHKIFISVLLDQEI